MPTYDDINKEFAPQRQRAQQQVMAQQQAAKDAISRRAAQLGGGPSGAAIAQEQNAIQAGGQQLEQANQDIDSKVQAEQQRRNEVEQGRAFTTSERLGSQGFAAEQANLGRQFTTSERLGSENFAHGERLGTQDFSAGEAAKGRDWQAGENAQQRSIQLYGVNTQDALQRAQMAQQGSQFQQSLAHETDVDEFNKGIASKLANQKDLLERILGPAIGGVEGSGALLSGLTGFLGAPFGGGGFNVGSVTGGFGSLGF